MKANLIAFAKNLLLAISIVTLAVIVPLNSVILRHPYEPVCVSCLVVLYAVPIAVVGLGIHLCKVFGKGRLHEITLITLTTLAIIAFLHVVQNTTIPKAWWMGFVIVSALGLSGLVAVFVQHGIEAVRAFLLLPWCSRFTKR